MPEMIDGSVACRISYGPSGGFYCDYCKREFSDRHSLPCDEMMSTSTVVTPEEIKETRLAKIDKWPRKRR